MDYPFVVASLLIKRTATNGPGRENDIPITTVNTLADFEMNFNLVARQMIITQEHPVAGPFQSIGIPVKFSGTSGQPTWPVPTLGEDTQDVLGLCSLAFPRPLGHELIDLTKPETLALAVPVSIAEVVPVRVLTQGVDC